MLSWVTRSQVRFPKNLSDSSFDNALRRLANARNAFVALGGSCGTMHDVCMTALLSTIQADLQVAKVGFTLARGDNAEAEGFNKHQNASAALILARKEEWYWH